MQTEQRRLIFIVLLAVIAAFIWHGWTQTHPAMMNTQNSASAVTSTVSSTTSGLSGGLPTLGNPIPTNTSTVAPAPAVNTEPNVIHVQTDVLDLMIDARTGNVLSAKLLDYAQSLDDKQPVQLFNDTDSERYVAESTFTNANQPPIVLNADKNQYQLAKDQQQLVVSLTGQDTNGIKVTKLFTFNRGSYAVHVNYLINNASSQNWQGNLYTQLIRKNNNTEQGGMFHINAFFGASLSTATNNYQKIAFNEIAKKPIDMSSPGGWVAMQQHYFLSAWVPNAQQVNQYYTKALADNTYAVGIIGPQVTVKPGQNSDVAATLYVGPALDSQLKATAPHLDLTIDYGWLWFISAAIFWCMQKVYNVIGNWGWSIIIVTILIKGLFYKLSNSSYKSMARMRDIAPKLKELQERFRDDRQKLSQATMELYRKEQVNPLGGCLPILIQLPVFIALYWVIVESVQFRQAPFIFWIHDLSVRDPYYILPILNGLAMFVQQKLNPPPPDPTQAKVMMLMPVIFVVLFLNFPSGLVLYWLTNSVFSIAQQWWVMRQMALHPEPKRKKKGKAK